MQSWASAYPPTEFCWIPDGPRGTRAVLARMATLIRSYRSHPTIRQLAVELTRPLPSRDYVGDLFVLRQFVRVYIRYVRDIRGVETLQTPVRTLENRAGDCDDHAILLGALAESIGAPVCLVAYGFLPEELYSHVLAQAQVGEKWLALETTVNGVSMGWEPPNAIHKMIENV